MILQSPFAISPVAGSYYSPISINAAQVPSAQTDFPVLVSQIDNRFKTVGNGGHVQNTNGYDIRPYSDSGLTSPLTYELERYNASTGEVIMWIKIASVSSSTTPIYLRYGDASLNTDGSDGVNTFSNSFLSVYHLKDGTTLSVADSLGGSGTNSGVTATAGQIDGAGSFVSASSQHINIRAIQPSAVTFSCWVNPTSFPASYNTAIGKNVSGSDFIDLFVKSNGKLGCFVYTSASVNYDGTGSHTLSGGTWYYLAMTYSSSAGLVGYVNAASDGTAAANGVITGASSNAEIGKDAVNGRYWNGIIDEARIASVARSADWITTEYNNQSTPSTFETLGAEVAL